MASHGHIANEETLGNSRLGYFVIAGSTAVAVWFGIFILAFALIAIAIGFFVGLLMMLLMMQLAHLKPHPCSLSIVLGIAAGMVLGMASVVAYQPFSERETGLVPGRVEDRRMDPR